MAELNSPDRELWRDRDGGCYADSIYVTKAGEIGINCGGHVIVKPIRYWHNLALCTIEQNSAAQETTRIGQCVLVEPASAEPESEQPLASGVASASDNASVSPAIPVAVSGLVARLYGQGLARTAGDAGHTLEYQAADLIERLVRERDANHRRAEAFKDAMHSYLDAAKVEKQRAEAAERDADGIA